MLFSNRSSTSLGFAASTPRRSTAVLDAPSHSLAPPSPRDVFTRSVAVQPEAWEDDDDEDDEDFADDDEDLDLGDDEDDDFFDDDDELDDDDEEAEVD